MKECDTYKADIYVGSLPGYTGDECPVEVYEEICRKYCDEVGLGLTVTRTKFVYTGGAERGVIVGLINYPRFPSTKYQIRIHAFELAKRLMKKGRQERVSIVFSDCTIMLEQEDLD